MRPNASVPERCNSIAPTSLMSASSADRILVLMGIRSEVVRPNLRRRFVPAKQLWHPVSASALMVA